MILLKIRRKKLYEKDNEIFFYYNDLCMYNFSSYVLFYENKQ